jgi:type IV pilus assembly protein PilB
MSILKPPSHSEVPSKNGKQAPMPEPSPHTGGRRNDAVAPTGSNLPAPVRAQNSSRRRLGDHLVAKHMITAQQLSHALEVQAKDPDEFLGHILVSLGYVSVKDMGAVLQEVTGTPYVDLDTYPIDPAASHLLPESLIRERLVLPLRSTSKQVWLAMVDPLDLYTMDDVRLYTGRWVVPLLTLPTDLLPVINRTFDARERATELAIHDIAGGAEVAEVEEEDQEIGARELLDQAEGAPIIRLVNSIIANAFAERASDIHMEPTRKGLRVRYRIDGVLFEQMTIPRASQPAAISRIKIMAHMDIAERRRPQDGRITRVYQNHAFDLRVSTIPTVFGEKAVLRVLDKESMSVSLEQIGFWPNEMSVWQQLITRPYGMVLVTGPTGSGKSTTLYASLNKINDIGKNITTIEDPVEYQLDGVNQTQVNVKAGVTFAAGLRTLVRQDPDIILVGEIRDKETAEVAINAALTGHLVFATLHTNDAPGAVVRLDNMGVEPFLVASSVLGVLGQRLLRNVCERCKEWYVPDAKTLRELGAPSHTASGEPVRFARGAGCKECNGKGYRGRSAVFEVMTMSDTLRGLILGRAASGSVKQKAIEEGMCPMHKSALRKVLAGITTPDEVARVLLSEEL